MSAGEGAGWWTIVFVAVGLVIGFAGCFGTLAIENSRHGTALRVHDSRRMLLNDIGYFLLAPIFALGAGAVTVLATLLGLKLLG